MKKTTYILIIAILLVIAGSFFLPVMMYTPRVVEQVELLPSSRMTVTQLEPFDEIYEAEGGFQHYLLKDNSKPLRIMIVETDTLKVPSIAMDSSWAGNLSAEVTDGKLALSVTMEAIRKEVDTTEAWVEVPGSNTTVATIMVPRGTLHKIRPGSLMAVLQGFVHATLQISDSWESYKIENSSFDTLELL